MERGRVEKGGRRVREAGSPWESRLLTGKGNERRVRKEKYFTLFVAVRSFKFKQQEIGYTFVALPHLLLLLLLSLLQHYWHYFCYYCNTTTTITTYAAIVLGL